MLSIMYDSLYDYDMIISYINEEQWDPLWAYLHSKVLTDEQRHNPLKDYVVDPYKGMKDPKDFYEKWRRETPIKPFE